MFITLDPSRIASIIPLIRPGDRVCAKLPELKVPAYLDATSVAPEGVHGTIDLEANSIIKRLYGWQLRGKGSHVYFATWEQIDRIYMRE